MGNGRNRELSAQRKEVIAKHKAKKTARLKAKKRMNAHIRERGEKFAKTDSCYKS